MASAAHHHHHDHDHDHEDGRMVACSHGETDERSIVLYLFGAILLIAGGDPTLTALPVGTE